MTIKIAPVVGARTSKKRVGRGNGSSGTYSGRGMKGQKSRTGASIRAQFEGGQTPFFQKMPKLKGFRNPNRVEYKALNVGLLNNVFQNGDTVSRESLYAKGLISKNEEHIKILGDGEITMALTIEGVKCSAAAREKIQKAGGKTPETV